MSVKSANSQFRVIAKQNKLSNAICCASKKLAVSTLLASVACTSWAGAADVREFSIKAQPLNEALVKFSTQSGLQLVVNGDAVRQFKAPELSGELRSDTALAQLLSDSGLIYQFREDDTVVIKEAEGSEPAKKLTAAKADEEVIVTGSRLATDPGKIAAQFISYDEAYIKVSGETTLERFLRRLPQNFQSTTEFAGSQLNNATNLTGASTVNLRGFGSNSTLILVDGRRRGSNGLLGGVTDISGIPLSQVERVEVVLDGASAIYGSDAVGGVVNIITKKDYQGIIAGIEYIEPDVGAFNEYKFTLSGGAEWGGGSWAFNYEYNQHTGLVSDDSRLGLIDPQTASLNLFNVPRAGFDPQVVGSVPLFYSDGSGNNITVDAFNALDPADQAAFTGINVATLPAGFNENSSLNDIVTLMATDNSVTGTGEADAGTLLLPERESHAFGVSVNKDLDNGLSLFGSVNYSTRDTLTGGALPTVSSRVDDGNPFNPFAQTFSYVAILPDGGRNFSDTDSDQWDFAFEINGDFNDEWSWSADATYSRSTLDSVRAPRLDTTTLAAGLLSNGGTEEVSVPVGAPSPSADCVFNRTQPGVFGAPPTDVYDCPEPDPISPFGSLNGFILPEQLASTRNELTTVGATINGSLFSLPAGDVSVAVGFEWQSRKINSSSEFSVSVVDTSSVGANPFDASISRDSQAAFVEGLAPLVGEANSIPFVQSLDITFSGRYDSYDAPDAVRNIDVPLDLSDPVAVAEFEAFNSPVAIGGDSTWGAGLIWGLNDQVRVRANWQTAFLAPQLNQLFRSTDPRFSRGFAFIFVEQPDGGLAFRPFDQILGGGNPQLENETSRSRTISLEFTPDFLPGLTASIAHAETRYINRIGSLNSNGAIIPLEDFQNNLFPSDLFVELDENGDLVSLGLDTRLKNAALVERSGFDARLNYVANTDVGSFAFDWSFSRISSQDSRPDITDPDVDVVGESTDSRFFPVPENSSNLQASWENRGMTVALSANRRTDTAQITLNSSDEVAFIRNTKSADIVNLTLSYDFETGDLFNTPAWMSGVVGTLGIENLTDSFSESTTLNVDTGELQVSRANAFTALGRGRVFNLRLQKEF
ncbi:TonB-dependent receptor domain-containing protein [Porticoccus sp. GXU_MW_L64]